LKGLEPAKTKKLKILIIDDESAITRMVGRLLRGAGYATIEVKCSEAERL
jgi:CheY-like chemotaxis protein